MDALRLENSHIGKLDITHLGRLENKHAGIGAGNRFTQNYMNKNSEKSHNNNIDINMIKSERYAYLYKPKEIPTTSIKPVAQTARRPYTTSLKSHTPQLNNHTNDLKSILVYFMKNRINLWWIKRRTHLDRKETKIKNYG